MCFLAMDSFNYRTTVYTSPRKHSMDVLKLKDSERNTLPIFASAKACLATDHPETLMEVRHQGKTNACSAFVLTAVTFGAQVRHKVPAVRGSPQEIVDYGGLFKRPKGGPETPTTGPYKLDERMVFSYKTVFKYATEIGISPVELYPWSGKCKFKKWDGSVWNRVVECNGKVIEPSKKIFIKGKKKLKPDKVEKYLQHQPLTGTIKVTEELRAWNGEGIYRGGSTFCYIGKSKDVWKHAVTIVGFGGEGDDAYFVCQNTYGIEWGYRGYFKAARHLITHKYIPKLLEEAGGSSSSEGGNSPGKGIEDDTCGLSSNGGSSLGKGIEDDTCGLSSEGGSSLGKRKRDEI